MEGVSLSLAGVITKSEGDLILLNISLHNRANGRKLGEYRTSMGICDKTGINKRAGIRSDLTAENKSQTDTWG